MSQLESGAAAAEAGSSEGRLAGSVASDAARSDVGSSGPGSRDGAAEGLGGPEDVHGPERPTAKTSYTFDPELVIYANPGSIYISENAGKDFRSIDVKERIDPNVKVTSLALAPSAEASNRSRGTGKTENGSTKGPGADSDQRSEDNTGPGSSLPPLLAGTSFKGIFESLDGGLSWQRFSEGMEVLYRGAGFYEEVSGICYHPLKPGNFIFAQGFGNGLYEYDRLEGRVKEISLPEQFRGKTINSIQLHHQMISPGNGGFQLFRGFDRWYIDISFDDASVSSARLAFKADKKGATELRLIASRAPESSDGMDDGLGVDLENAVSDIKAEARREQAQDRYGAYVRAPLLSGRSKEGIRRILKTAKRYGLNSLVVDFKDDFGFISYASDVPLAEELEALRSYFDAETLVELCKEEDIYLIARLVVFKDKVLFGYKENEYAFWDKEHDRPWGQFASITDRESGKTRRIQVDYWVDPHAEEVRAYNIELAKEIEKLGVDEIQFDYIRFPSDGKTEHIHSRYAAEGKDRVDALEAFLSSARGEISVPISVDVFGFNAWYRMVYLGQDVEMLSRYVDVICPMYYPSHFTRSFMPRIPYFDRAYQIYRDGSSRMRHITKDRVLIRPYVQAFLIGNELDFERPEYSQYLKRQIEGVKDSPASGFLLWNASGNYYMVTDPLQVYTKQDTMPGGK